MKKEHYIDKILKTTTPMNSIKYIDSIDVSKISEEVLNNSLLLELIKSLSLK